MDFGTCLFTVFVIACAVLAGVAVYMHRAVLAAMLLVLPIVVFIGAFIYAGLKDEVGESEYTE
jgi:hypothetical protein